MAQPVTPSTPRSVRPPERRDTRRLRSVLFDADTPLSLSPLELLFFSLAFIVVVFLAHILLKAFPATSPTQVLIAMLALLASYLFRRAK